VQVQGFKTHDQTLIASNAHNGAPSGPWGTPQ
jgi:hypothetical protein